jgi:hypothetical protein
LDELTVRRIGYVIAGKDCRTFETGITGVNPTATLLVANKKPNVRDVMEDDDEATTAIVPR